ncbi:Putative short-chain dehydrogenase/reductase family protein [Bradyrhizobium sp. ORS 278]|uniref:SDR family NAD(P)-dependent oxidoreductase n=1 Tax=Bradyrhizobium sp. (strain ORS 278) TaxID=114615 RepID=UPI00015088C3|nr:SDR family oxidoreductase [Bradyrhizobium sp. ORS 278]CAL78870.1 Putative short-chain dehydrogenase/reductase family protein [Bradyrhizobium sp. ORS 278]
MTVHAVVIGGTRGLGRVVVERFLARGCAVSVVSRQRPADFPEQPGLAHFAADLERSDSFAGLWREIADGHGPVRYLVLSQRFRGQGDPWAGEIQVGLTASRDLIEGFSGHFAEAGDRAIGVVSSVYAEFVGSSQPVGYHVVKGGLNAMVRHYAATLGRRGIRVNAIMPLTYLKRESRTFYEQNEKLMETYRRLVPLGRLGTAEECADALDFLCSERASFINGQSLFLDGGVSTVWQEEVAKSFAGL